MPKIKEVTVLPKCDYCGADAKYDAPTLVGHWAYMCKVCSGHKSTPKAVAMGTEFVLKSQVVKSLDPKKVIGLEPEDYDYWASITMGNGDREIECPTCRTTRTVEPDADYEYLCDCGATVKVPCPVI